MTLGDSGSVGPVAQASLKLLWSGATLVGLRRLATLLPKQYADTAFFFDGVESCVALTIDDGLCRRGEEGASLVEEVRELLARHNAQCTFFVCSKYLAGVEAAAGALVADGHELGNHMAEDLNMVYPKMAEAEFAAALRANTEAIEALPGAPRVRWFRAPQGVLSTAMSHAVQSQQLRHALGDAYCDDWAMSHNVPYVVRTLLRQVTPGSIIVLHMPEKGFREHTFRVLERLLDGLDERGLRCATLSECAELQLASSLLGKPLSLPPAAADTRTSPGCACIPPWGPCRSGPAAETYAPPDGAVAGPSSSSSGGAAAADAGGSGGDVPDVSEQLSASAANPSAHKDSIELV